MAVDTRGYTDEHGDPVVVYVARGTFDVSRILGLLSRGRVEDCAAWERLTRQVRRSRSGRAAMKLLADHGGPDFTLDSTDPEVLEARELVRAEIREVECLYVRTINACLEKTAAPDADLDRWRGHAEAYRSMLTTWWSLLGEPCPAYGSQEWRNANGVHTPESIASWPAARKDPGLHPVEPTAVVDLGADKTHVHLVRYDRDGGTPGPTLCGVDRFANWSSGFSMYGPFRTPENPASPVDGKTVCPTCTAQRHRLLAARATKPVDPPWKAYCLTEGCTEQYKDHPQDTDDPTDCPACHAPRKIDPVDVRERYADAEPFLRLLRKAIGDPGRFTPRGRHHDGSREDITAWGARAVAELIAGLNEEASHA